MEDKQTKNKVGIKEILAIPPGVSFRVCLPTGKARASLQSTCYMLPVLHPRTDVSRYSCHTEKPSIEGYPITITAIPNEQN